jgi:hypothetical protein
MFNFRLLLTLLMLGGIIYGILNMKAFLEDNFVKNDTKIKTQLNDFLNGKQKVPTSIQGVSSRVNATINRGIKKPNPSNTKSDDPSERIIEIEQRQLDEVIKSED